jgi:predicted PurR-regulated permease PerM
MPESTPLAEGLQRYIQKLFIGAAVAVGTALVFALLWYALDIVLITFAGALLALILRVPADWISRRTALSPRWALGLVLLVLVLLAAGFFYMFSSNLQQALQGLSKVLPSSLSELEQKLVQIGIPRHLIDELRQAGSGGGMTGRFISGATQYFSSFVTLLMHFVIILFVGLFIAFDPQTYVNGFLRLFRPAYRPQVEELLHDIAGSLKQWMLGRLIDMGVVGSLTVIGLWSLGIPLAISLSVIAALLTIIPNLGPILSVAPAFLVAFSQGFHMALYVVLLYIGVQTVESYLIIPFVQQKAVHIPPALLLIAQILFGLMAGTLGLIVAAPIVATLMVLVNRLYVDRFVKKGSPSPA